MKSHLSTNHILSSSISPENFIRLCILSIIVGVLGGLAAATFTLLLRGLNYVFHDLIFPAIDIYVFGIHLGWLVLPIFGAALALLITFKYAPECRGSGIPELMYSVTLNRGRIRKRTIPSKLIASALTVTSGGSAGREGPAAHVGGAIGSTLGNLLKLSPFEIRILIAGGVAGAVAGTFNAPLGGAIFGLEVLFHGIGLFSIIPMFLSSVAGAMINTAIFGDFVDFPVSTEWPWMQADVYIVFIVFGILFGLLSYLWKTLFLYTSRFYNKYKIDEKYRPLWGALVTGIVLSIFPDYGLTGTGYVGIYMILQNQLFPLMMLLLGVLKMITTSQTVASGGSGGLFGPTIFIGAMFGGFLGSIISVLFPGVPIDKNLYVLIGMGALFAGSTQSPINIVVIIGEMTRNFSVIPLLMTACACSFIVSWLFFKGTSIYTVKFEQMGISLKNQSFFMLQNLEVDDAMSYDLLYFDPETPLDVFLEQTNEIDFSIFPILKHQMLDGIITRDHKHSLKELDEPENIKLKDVMQKEFITIARYEYIQDAIDLMVEKQVNAIIVLENEDSKKIVGVLTKKDILKICEMKT